MQANLYSAGRTDTWLKLWLHKLDTDPHAKEQLPHRWVDVDYLVATPALYGARTTRRMSPGAKRFGTARSSLPVDDGATRIDIRSVNKPSS